MSRKLCLGLLASVALVLSAAPAAVAAAVPANITAAVADATRPETDSTQA